MTDEADMILCLDATGDPILLAVGDPRVKSGVSVVTPVKSGNPFRDPASGTFGSGPAGSKVTEGEELMKGLSNPAKIYVTQMRNKLGATEIKAKPAGNGRVSIILLKNGAQVGSLSLPAGSQQQGAPAPQTRDELVNDARTKEIEALQGRAREQRINDLVDYLYARYSAAGAAQQPKGVHVAAPSNFARKTIGGLEDTELQDVARRLRARGWNNDGLKKIVFPNVDASRRDKIIQENL